MKQTLLHSLFQLIGWLLFVLCAVLFLISGLRAEDPLLVVGSVVFLIACIVFILPLVFELAEVRRR